MRVPRSYPSLTVFVALLCVVSAFAGEPVSAVLTSNTAPKIKFDSETFDAGKVPGGKPLNHTFVFTNVGNQTLEVTKVTGTCHCTVVDNNWTKKVEPGKTGVIPVTIDVRPEWSGPMGKTVNVECNDKSRPAPSFALNINFTVWKPLDVSPQYAFLNVPAESANEVSTVVRVDNNTPEPVAVYDARSSIPALAVQIKTNDPGKHYEFVIRASPPFGQNVSSQITARTSSKDAPSISLTATLSLQPVFAIIPPQVVLEPGPLTNTVQKLITIRYQGSSSVHLTSGGVNAQNVDVQIAVTQSGKAFTAILSFPPGFELHQPSQPVELTLNTSSSHTPLIKIPIFQYPPSNPIVPQSRRSGATAPPQAPSVSTRSFG